MKVTALPQQFLFKETVDDVNSVNNTSSGAAGSIPRSSCDLEWQNYLKIICLPCLLVLGLFGNTVSFLVMSSSTYRRKSYSYYLRALALSDTMTLLLILLEDVNAITHHLAIFEHGILYAHTNVTCKLSVFAQHVIQLMSSWLVVGFTIDRYIAVCHPLYRARLCRERSAIYNIIGTLVAILLSQSYHLYYVTKNDAKPHDPCFAYGTKEEVLRYMEINYILFSTLLLFGVPFVIMLFCNSQIIYHISYMAKLRVNNNNDRQPRRVHLAIYTLYAVCCMFVVTLLPNVVLSLVQYFAFTVFHTWSLLCILRQLSAPFQIIRLINYTCNFILYGLTGRRFRLEVKALLQTCRRRDCCHKPCCGDHNDDSKEEDERQHNYEMNNLPLIK